MSCLVANVVFVGEGPAKVREADAIVQLLQSGQGQPKLHMKTSDLTISIERHKTNECSYVSMMEQCQNIRLIKSARGP